MHIFEDVDVKPSSRHEFIKAWFDRILTVNGVLYIPVEKVMDS